MKTDIPKPDMRALEEIIDRYGADMSLWPSAELRRMKDFVTNDPAAQEFMQDAVRIEEHLAVYAQQSAAVADSIADAVTARVLLDLKHPDAEYPRRKLPPPRVPAIFHRVTAAVTGYGGGVMAVCLIVAFMAFMPAPSMHTDHTLTPRAERLADAASDLDFMEEMAEF